MWEHTIVAMRPLSAIPRRLVEDVPTETEHGDPVGLHRSHGSERGETVTWHKFAFWATLFCLNVWKLWAGVEGHSLLETILDFLIPNAITAILSWAFDYLRRKLHWKLSWFFEDDCRDHICIALNMMVVAFRAFYANTMKRITVIILGDHSIGQPALLLELEGRTAMVWSVAFTPDGKRIVSGCTDGTIQIWDAETGEAIIGPLTGHTGTVTSVEVSPDGKLIASGSKDETVRIWDVETGASVCPPCYGHTSIVMSISLSPDGKRVASGSDDRTIRIWEAESGNAVCSPLKGHTGTVESVSFSPSGRHIVSASWDKSIRIWDAESGNLFRVTLIGHKDAVTSASFSHDGRRIVSGSWDESIRIWDVATGELIKTIQGHTAAVTSAAFSSNGDYIVSCSGDRTIRIWDTESGEQLGDSFKGHTNAVMSISLSPDGSHIVSGSLDGTVRVRDSGLVKLKHPIGPLLQGIFHSCRYHISVFMSRIRTALRFLSRPYRLLSSLSRG